MVPAPSSRVSILLPTHNRADVLPFAIQSALAQTWHNFELIVVGDGCTDNTATVVQSFADARIVWHDLPKTPAFGYANRNLAHDDLWFPDHLAQLISCLVENDAELAYSLPLHVTASGRVEPMVFNLHDPLIWDLWRTRQLGYLAVCSVIHRKSCLDRYGYWSEKLSSRADWELWMRIMRAAPRPNFAYWPLATSLHFVANWRRYKETWRRNWWRRLCEWEGSAVPPLKIDLSAGATEQEAVWTAMSRAPTQWVADLRRAVQVDVDRRGAYRLTLSDALETARRYLRRLGSPKQDWSKFALRDRS